MPRPRAFNEADVLDAALESFWGRGFEATSVRDLADAMGISGPSLYNAFGDKRGLYGDALEHYCRTRTYPLLEQIEAEHPGAAAVPAFFAAIIERSLADGERRGCFLINSALERAPHDAAIAAAVNSHLGNLRAFLSRGIAAMRHRRTRQGAERSADHLLAVLLGIRLLARTRPDRGVIVATVRSALLSVGYSSSQLRALETPKRPRHTSAARRGRAASR